MKAGREEKSVPYACVLFDVYQTLVVKTPTIIQRLDQVLCDLQLPHTRDEVERLAACCEYQTGSHARKTGFGMDDERFLAHMISFYCTRLYPRKADIYAITRSLTDPGGTAYTLMPGAWDVLAGLKQKGIKLGVVCNGTASIRHVLEEMALTDFFDCIVISDEAGVQKPDPAIIRLACERCGVLPQQTIYAGDHPFDVLCAQDAGAAAAWLPSNAWFQLAGNAPKPEYMLRSLMEIC